MGCKLRTFGGGSGQQPKENRFCNMDNCMAVFEFLAIKVTDPFF